MTNSPATALPPRRIHPRAWLIFLAVAVAVAVPVLPLKFLGIPGPDFPDMSQVVQTSKTWLSKMAASFDPNRPSPLKTPTENAVTVPGSTADQVKMLEVAAKQLTSEIDSSPSDPSLQNRLGLVYLSLGDVDRACDHFQKAVSLARLGITALGDKIAGYKNDGKTAEASNAVLDASKLNVELSAAHSNLARVYERRGEHDKVVSELELLNREGVLFDSTVASQTQPVKRKLLNPQVARSLARAEALWQAGRLQMAADEYRHVLTQDPNVAMAHHRLGTILSMTNNPSLAATELEMAAKLDPDSAVIQNDLGLVNLNLGLPTDAACAFEKAISLDPHATEASLNLSNLYCSQGKVDEAKTILSRAIEKDPTAAKAHNNLASILAMEGKLGPALAEFQRAVTLAPTMPSAHYGLGTVLLQAKNYGPAMREFKQTLALDPHFVAAETKMEEAQRKAGRETISANTL